MKSRPQSVACASLAVWLMVCLAKGTSSTTFAQEQVVPATNFLSLNECIAIAIQQHPGIKARRSTLGAACEQVNIAHSYFLPQVDVGANYTFIDEPRSVDVNLLSGELGDRLVEAATFFEIARNSGSAAAVAALDDIDGPVYQQFEQLVRSQFPATVRTDLLGQNFVTSQIKMVQPLWTNGKIQSRHRQAIAAGTIARNDVVQTRNEIAFNVARAYLSVLLSRDLYKVSNNAAEYAAGVAELAESLTQDTSEDWKISEADILRAKTFEALYREQAVGLRVAAVRATVALKLAMGFPQSEAVEVIDETLPIEHFDFDLDQLQQWAMSNRPELKKVSSAVSIARLEKKVAQASRLPEVGAYAAYNTINDDESFPNPNDPAEWAVGVAASMPLYTGGRNSAQVRQAQYLESQAVQQQRLVLQLVQQEVADAYFEFVEMSERLRQDEEAVRNAQSTVEVFKALFGLGEVSSENASKYFEDRLTSQLLLLTAQGRYCQSLFGYNLAAAKVRLTTALHPLTQLSGETAHAEDLPVPADDPEY